MKKSSNRIFSLICAVMLMTGAVSAWAAAEGISATPTDLTPAAEGEPVTEPGGEEEKAPTEKTAGDKQEEPVDSVEMIITKSIGINELWEGRMKKTRPAVLKLDLAQAGTVHILVEGKGVWVTVEKTDRQSDDTPQVLTDPVTGRAVIDLEAEAGSYLITLGPAEPNLMAQAAVTAMDDEAFAAWNPGEAEETTEQEPREDPGTEGENIPESKTETGRSITVEVTWDVPNPVIGDTAHMKAHLAGYDGLQYTMQWQYSPDQVTWYDIPGETNEAMDVVVTRENNVVYWRILVFVEENGEE